MPLNACEAEFFAKIAERNHETPTKSYDQMTVADFRQVETLFNEFMGAPVDVPTEDLSVPVRDGSEVRLRIFNADVDAPSPVLIMYPGCGYLFHLFESNAVACSRIAAESGIKVILVDIRVAPEDPLPTGINDAYDATHYIATHSEQFGIDANAISIGGQSSGAHTATVVAMMATDDPALNIEQQILLNGIYDYSQPHSEYAEFEAVDQLTNRDATPTVSALYGVPNNDFSDPLYSPLYNPNMAALPPTTIIVSEYDGLRSDSELYFQTLEKAGVDVQRKFIEGQSHSTFLLREVMFEGEDPASVIAQCVNTSPSPSHSIKT